MLGTIGICTELGDPYSSPLYKLQTFSPHLKLWTVQPLLDTCSSSCISIGRTCSAHQSLHGATIIGSIKVCTKQPLLCVHAWRIKVCTDQPLLDVHARRTKYAGSNHYWTHMTYMLGVSKYARSNHFWMCMLGASKYAPCNHYWPTLSEHKAMRGATIIGYLL